MKGGFAAELAERVARGERRPVATSWPSPGRPRRLREALTGRLRRVVRIAVAPQRRREGLGQALIEAELERARDDGRDLLGASFGAEPGLIAFWQREGFRAVRLGLSRETATGEHALMVARATSAGGEALIDSLVARFQRALPGLLAFELRDLAPEVAAAPLAEGDGPAPYRRRSARCRGMSPPATASRRWHDRRCRRWCVMPWPAACLPLMQTWRCWWPGASRASPASPWPDASACRGGARPPPGYVRRWQGF